MTSLKIVFMLITVAILVSIGWIGANKVCQFFHKPIIHAGYWIELLCICLAVGLWRYVSNWVDYHFSEMED